VPPAEYEEMNYKTDNREPIQPQEPCGRERPLLPAVGGAQAGGAPPGVRPAGGSEGRPARCGSARRPGSTIRRLTGSPAPRSSPSTQSLRPSGSTPRRRHQACVARP
jgi:hypothetical protein